MSGRKFRILHPTIAVILLILLVIFHPTLPSAQSNEHQCGVTPKMLESFTTRDGKRVVVFEDGKLYFLQEDGSCTFVVQYFDPDFVKNYVTLNSKTFLVFENGDLFPTQSNFVETFEHAATLTELLARSVSETNKYWTSFTLQSPLAPTVLSYVQLRSCLLQGTCDFRDNKIEIAVDPTHPLNHVLKFSSVPPSADMITAKASMQSMENYFVNGSDVWYQAEYYIESGMPFSIVDFENTYFLEGPGPRVVVRNNALAIENKFGSKITYTQSSDVPIPLKQWFTVKVHLKYSNKEDGMIELWQDGTLLISTTGITLPTSNSIQDSLEVGITATGVGCVLLLDNVRISETPF